MNNKLTIQQWYARAVAAGIAPNWDNVLAIYDFHYLDSWYLQDSTNNGIINCLGGTDIENGKYPGETIQLRKNGVDLVELWTKEDIPTEKDKGKEVYLKLSYGIIRGNLNIINKTKEGITIYGIWNGKENLYTYHCLLATNGNIAPTQKDFEKVYGEI